MKKRLIVLLLVLAMSLSIVACNKSNDSGGSGDKVEITAAYHLLPNGLEPLSEDSVQNYAITYHIFDRLVTFDPVTNAWGPAVAKSWERIDDVTWHFEINMDYKFSNGDAITMDDIVYSLLRLRDIPKTADSGNLIDSVTYEGNTLIFKTIDASNTIPSRVLSSSVIVNKKYLEETGDEGLYLKPIGTGPYAVTEFTPGASATIEVWDGYPFTKPQIDIINFIAIEDTSARYMALETGRAQYAHQLSFLEINNAEQNDSLSTVSTTSRRNHCFVFQCERPPFDNPNIRRALTYALDRESYAQLNGGRTPIRSLLFMGYSDYYVESSNLPGYDLEIARQMLADEGYDESNPLRVELVTYQGDPGLELYQSALKSIGVDFVLNIVEFSVFLTHEGAGDFDMVATVQINRGNHPMMDLDRFDYNMAGMRDISFYHDVRVQELVELMRVENDQQRLKEMSVEINDLVGYDVPMVAILLQPILAATHNGLSGVVVDTGNTVSFRSATFNP